MTGGHLEATLFSIITAALAPFAAGLIDTKVEVSLLMRVFAKNPKTAKVVGALMSLTFLAGLIAAIIMTALLMGDDYGAWWLAASFFIYLSGEAVYKRWLSPYSMEQLQNTTKFLHKLIKPRNNKPTQD